MNLKNSIGLIGEVTSPVKKRGRPRKSDASPALYIVEAENKTCQQNSAESEIGLFNFTKLHVLPFMFMFIKKALNELSSLNLTSSHLIQLLISSNGVVW